MVRVAQDRPAYPYWDCVIEWLRTKNRRKNEAAESILCRLGKPVVEFLIREVLQPGKRPDHRVRLLNVIQRIGGPLGPEEYYGIRKLLAHEVTRISEKASEVLTALSPGGPPPLVPPEVMAAAMKLHPACCMERALRLGKQRLAARQQRSKTGQSSARPRQYPSLPPHDQRTVN